MFLKVEESFKERNFISRISSAGLTTTLVGHISHNQRRILPCEKEKKQIIFPILRNFVVIFCHREYQFSDAMKAFQTEIQAKLYFRAVP